MSPCSHWTIVGTSNDPKEWIYYLSIPTPSGNRNKTVRGAEVIHAMYARDNNRPWDGLSPLQYASLTGELGSQIETTLRDEESGVTAKILPVPDVKGGTDADGNEIDRTGQLRENLGAAKGGTILTRTTQGSWEKGA